MGVRDPSRNLVIHKIQVKFKYATIQRYLFIMLIEHKLVTVNGMLFSKKRTKP